MNEREPMGRHPVENVPLKNAVREGRRTVPRGRDERGAQFETIHHERALALLRPDLEALHEVAGGAADIEECPVTVDGCENELPRLSPQLCIPIEAGLPARIIV